MDKKDKFIIVVAVAILAAWGINFYFNPPQPPQPKEITTENKDSDGKFDDDKKNPDGKTSPDGNDKKPDNGDSSKPPKEIVKAVKKVIDEDFEKLPDAPADVTLKVGEAKSFKGEDGPKVIYHIDTANGGISEVELAEFESSPDSGKVQYFGNKAYPMLALQSDKFSFSKAKLVKKTDKELVIKRQVVGRKLFVEQTWTIHKNLPKGNTESEKNEELRYKIRFINKGESDFDDLDKFLIRIGSADPLDTAQGFMGAGGIDQSVQYKPIDDDDTDYNSFPKIKGFDQEDKDEYANRSYDWFATCNKFFSSIITLTADKEKASEIKGVSLEAKTLGDEDGAIENLSTYMTIPLDEVDAGEDETLEYSFTVGPKNYRDLKAMGDKKEDLMQYNLLFIIFKVGLMEWIALGIYYLIIFFSSNIGSYGLAIILTTITIRAIFWPVTHKSAALSKKMRDIQPEAKKINEKYKDDPQQKFREIQQLYRREKVNPLMGCLPVLFQIPVFFALFNVLRTSIELRHKGFLWINDLSMPDAIFGIEFFAGIGIHPLAICMAVTMFLQMKLSPTSPDPNQQKMMYIMMGVMFIFCYAMPSGLTLYWTVSNICTIIQTKVTYRMMNKSKEKENKPKGDSKGDVEESSYSKKKRLSEEAKTKK